MKKELLIVYNMFGYQPERQKYYNEIDKILWHIKQNNLENDVRFVISAVLKDDITINELKEKYPDIKIFRYEYRWTLQVSFNKTVNSAITEFNEDYNGYFYISAGLMLGNQEDLIPRLIEINNTGKYGIMHLHCEGDANGYCQPRENIRDLQLGEWCDFIVAVINKDMRDFYGLAVSDIHGVCCMEATLSYSCAALRKKYVLVPNSTCLHVAGSDSERPKFDRYGNIPETVWVKCGLMWDREFKSFLEDEEAVDAGLGYYPNNNNGLFPNFWFKHKEDKYDEEGLAIDERLKYGVKRNFFTNKSEVDYDKIVYELI